jgi:probable rRNA maturation factor
MAVTIQNSQPIPIERARLLQAAKNALRAEGAETAEVSVLLTDDETIHDLNLRYRGYDKPTDVLSFSQVESLEARVDSGKNPHSRLSTLNSQLLGDVVISIETAVRQADTHGITLDEELALLVTHGILHLLGYEDETEPGMVEMESRERALGVRP